MKSKFVVLLETYTSHTAEVVDFVAQGCAQWAGQNMPSDWDVSVNNGKATAKRGAGAAIRFAGKVDALTPAGNVAVSRCWQSEVIEALTSINKVAVKLDLQQVKFELPLSATSVAKAYLAHKASKAVGKGEPVNA